MIAAIGSVLRRGRVAAALGLLAAFSPGAAQAQLNVSKTSIRLGAFFSTDSNLKSQTSSVWNAVGLDALAGVKYHPLGGDIHIGFDAVWHGGGSSGGSSLSLSGKLLWPLSPKGTNSRLWAGAGFGGYMINTPNTTNFLTVGAKFIVGADLTSHWFVEADYDWVSGFTDDLGVPMRADGVTLALGYRF